jgi:heme exporter protein C
MNKILSILIFALITPAALYAVFCYAPLAKGLGATTRLLYLHVPLALCAVVSFILSGWHAFRFLVTRGERHCDCSHTAAKLGFLFTIFTTVTGAVWAKLIWGSWWNWDIRESSILFLVMVYTAYFILRGAVGSRPGADRFAAAYLLFAAAIMPFFVFVAPRITESLHPQTLINPERSVLLTGRMKIALLLSAASFLSLFFILYLYEIRIAFTRRAKMNL